jgi:hypothetical protein
VKLEKQLAPTVHRSKENVNLLKQIFLEEKDSLKQADLKPAKYLLKRDSVNREQKSNQDLLVSEINKKSQLENVDNQLGDAKIDKFVDALRKSRRL